MNRFNKTTIIFVFLAALIVTGAFAGRMFQSNPERPQEAISPSFT